MLSIAKLAGKSHVNYYLDLAREDYYLNGGEPPAKWHGPFAERLSLTGNVDKEQLRSLFAGFHPQTAEPLVQQQKWKDRSRTPGWDLTFSAPKSVSAIWATADPNTRQAIQTAQEEAVRTALDYLQANAGFSRIGKSGSQLIKCELAFALCEHGTSRNQDPQLHSHVLTPNVGRCSDGKTRALHTQLLYEHKMSAGALYRAELAYQLTQRLGLSLERDGEFFRVSVIPNDVEEHYSTRRAEIVKELSERGHSSAEAAKLGS